MSTRKVEKVCGFFLAGLGCSFNDEMLKYVSDYFQTCLDPTFVLCNKSTTNTVFTIFETTVTKCHRFTKSDKYVQDVFKQIMQQIHYDKIIIVGHSYGGAVACKIAEIFNDQPDEIRGKINIATFGSVYIPKTKLVKNFLNTPVPKLVHYMHVYDVSLRCNGLAKDMNHVNKNVVWIKQGKDTQPNAGFVKNLKQGFIYHMMYENLISNIFQFRTIHLDQELDRGKGTFLAMNEFDRVVYDKNFNTPTSFVRPSSRSVGRRSYVDGMSTRRSSPINKLLLATDRAVYNSYNTNRVQNPLLNSQPI